VSVKPKQPHLDAITTEDVDTLATSITQSEEEGGKGLSAKTARNTLTVLSKCLKIAKRWKLINTVPDIELPKTGDPEWYYLEREDAAALVDVAEPKIKGMVYLALQTGMRLGELLGLRRRDLNLRSHTVHVRKAYTRGELGAPKNHAIRDIPITQDCAYHLRQHLEAAPECEFVFCDENGILNKQKVRDPLDRAYKAAEIPGYKRGWHIMRHTYATQMAGSGMVTLRDLQKLLGHKTKLRPDNCVNPVRPMRSV
jgi:integrase